ncbi:NEL-type E3 ubiquitin ligase domain-containing protein [Pseudomonas sp. NPDC096950]|uniref:NEL-type E3 ubiquitin ligase domain-containing protein n=1 Tax=Pseudomonas sp. NPDC096950 TaxID=3364485 RepID=UPI00383A3070
MDRLLDSLKDIHGFAEPLLSAALKRQYRLDLDVQATWLKLYIPKEHPWYVIDTSDGVITRTVSLLDAALHNFSSSETFEVQSEFITRPDQLGHFDVLPIKQQMTLKQFQTLCRELNIGARYRRHLQQVLLPTNPVAAGVLRHLVSRNQKSALKLAAHLALKTKDISQPTHASLLGLLHGLPNLTLDGNVMQACDLRLMDTTLTGILVFTPVQQLSNRAGSRILVYVPHDPDHPLKEYPSATACVVELSRQLLENKILPSTGKTYRQFFSQFVDQQQRGHFFAGLEQRLSQVKWHEKAPTDPTPSWRETPVSRPNLQVSVVPISDPLWEHLYQQSLNKILNDGREIAVSTGDADSRSRWAWWDNFKKILSDIFNVALMVLAPFVPGLGELMLAYTAYQLTTDVIEGVVDLAEGLWAEAAEHVIGVVTDVIQLATFGVGGAIGGAFKLKLSPLIEGMTPVQLPSGKTVLWNPDLGPYEQKQLSLGNGSVPDHLGLHNIEGQDVLPLDRRLYTVKKDPATGDHRILHPTRPDAYTPKVTHNGHGAWLLEGENPRSWDAYTLMKRLGHRTDGFNAEQLDNIRRVSGTDEGVLLRMHVEHTPPPLLLDDTLKRYGAIQDVDAVREQIRSGTTMDSPSYWFEQLVTELPGWPADYTLNVYERSDLTGLFRTYGSPQSSARQTLRISLAEVIAGTLPERVVGFLDDAQLADLLGASLPSDQRVQALRDRLVVRVDQRKADLADYLYRARAISHDANVWRLQQQYPELPTDVAETLLAGAASAELETMTEQRRIPLRLKGQARECAFETRAARAFEGFYQDDRMTADTERLALNVLRLNSDTFNALRIEVRDGTFDGPLRCQVGADERVRVRVLVRDENGHYEVRSPENRQLHPPFDLFESILRAIPAAARRDLGYSPGQGAWFKTWLMAKAEAPAERRTALLEPPIRPVAQWETMLLLRGPALSRQAKTLEQRVQDLYPHLSEREVDTFIRSLPRDADPVQVVKTLERELNKLRNVLKVWQEEMATPLPDDAVIPPDAVRHLVERLVECFERKPRVFDERSTPLTGGYALDLSSDLRRYNLEHWWKKLPDIKTWLDQIITLNLDGMEFSQRSDGMLRNFTQLRQFSARRCGLTGLPAGVGKMSGLETLRLSDNRIRLTEEAVVQLANLTRLQTLRLEYNVLGLTPNVQRMPRLKVVNLAYTGIDTWPEGLLGRPRPRGFFLDLSGNPIRTIPRAVRGSNNAWTLARARLDARQLLDAHRQALHEYRRSVGLPRENIYQPLAQSARDKWPLNDDSSLWGNRSPGLGTWRAEAWDNLMNEANSEGFFRLIDSLTTSADYRAGGWVQEQLSRRVWELIDAMDLDTPLREKLFRTAENPENCEDASSEIFNRMGVQALASQAYAYSTSAAELEPRLVKLSKGAARLDRVNQIALADSLSRPSRAEEVEIYLAYQTSLAPRLGLPWQSDSMLYRAIAAVSDDAIERAYSTVLEREGGDGLVNGMLEQPFWENYLRETYPEHWLANDQTFDQQLDALEELRNTPGSQPPITDQAYSVKLNELAYNRLALGRRLTRDLLKKYALDEDSPGANLTPPAPVH